MIVLNRKLITIVCATFLLALFINKIRLEKAHSLPGTSKERDIQRKQDLATISKLLYHYSQNHNYYYPPSPNFTKIFESSDSAVYSALVPQYIDHVPKEVNPLDFYRYITWDFSKHYTLSAHLESRSDRECVISGKYCVYRINDKGNILTRK